MMISIKHITSTVPYIVTTEELLIIYTRNVVYFRYIIVNTLYNGDNR